MSTTNGTNDSAVNGVTGAAANGADWLGAGRDARRAHTRAVTHQVASVLLGYPDEVFFERLPLAARAAAELPRSQSRTHLLEFCEHAATTPEPELAAHYAGVFDTRRRCALHMTYYTEGETGGRGHTLAEFTRVYAEAGWQVGARELPDHLAVILEFSARGDADAGLELLVDFRSGLDLLSRSLREHGTPYTRVVDAVRHTLPPAPSSDGERVHHLIREGASTDEVGVEPRGVRPRIPRPRADVSEKQR
jgi:nitrate reductase delta subunit